MSKIKAVLFDYDGTLRDSRSLIYASLQHTFEAHGLPAPTKDDLAPHIHHHSFVQQALAPQVPYQDFDDVYFQKVDELMPLVGLYAGTQEVLRSLHKAGYKIGLVTAAKTATEDVKRLDVAEHFDVIITANDISKHKPDPEGLNLALEQLGITPDEAVYVGDMPTDIYAAKAARLKAAIGLTIGMASRRELETAGADVILDDLLALPACIAELDK